MTTYKNARIIFRKKLFLLECLAFKKLGNNENNFCYQEIICSVIQLQAILVKLPVFENILLNNFLFFIVIKIKASESSLFWK